MCCEGLLLLNVFSDALLFMWRRGRGGGGGGIRPLLFPLWFETQRWHFSAEEQEQLIYSEITLRGGGSRTQRYLWRYTEPRRTGWRGSQGIRSIVFSLWRNYIKLQRQSKCFKSILKLFKAHVLENVFIVLLWCFVFILQLVASSSVLGNDWFFNSYIFCSSNGWEDI